MAYSPNLTKWLTHVKTGSPGLEEVLDDDCVFLSPVVHTPQQGKAITMAYLSAAGNVLGDDEKEPQDKISEDGKFGYTKIIDGESQAMLEFESQIDDIKINGVDIITWNDEGLITEFKVMVRPLKAIQKVHANMAAMLAKMQGKDAA